MAAGIAASRHFPELQMISHEGKTFFTRRIGPLPGSCDPMSFRSGYPLRHCCLHRPPFETLPGIAAWRRLFRLFRPKPEFCWTVRKVGSASACAFASRFFLARPASRFLRFQPCGLSRSPRWRHSLSALPFPAGRSWPASGSCARLPSRTSGFLGCRDDSRGVSCAQPVDGLWISDGVRGQEPGPHSSCQRKLGAQWGFARR